MEITWWGTAAFQIKTKGSVFLIDPFLTRNAEASPSQYLTPDHIREGTHIFLTHGHFDHVMDVPDIARQNRAMVHCSEETASLLMGQSLTKRLLKPVRKDGESHDIGAVHAQACFSHHIKPDIRLIAKTLLRANFRLVKLIPLIQQYPPGQVLSWRFTLENKTIHFFGTGGSSAEELERLSSMKTDVLFIPLQGHTNISDIALEYVQVCRPDIVIPHHHDNFFPPISESINLSTFIERVKTECPDSTVRVLSLNETFILE